MIKLVLHNRKFEMFYTNSKVTNHPPNQKCDPKSKEKAIEIQKQWGGWNYLTKSYLGMTEK